MTQNEKLAAAILTGFVLALREPELMQVANAGATLVNESLKNPNLGGLIIGGLISVAAFAAALEKHPELLRAKRRRSRTKSARLRGQLDKT